MLAEKLTPAAHGGEAQASSSLVKQQAHWEAVESGLLALPAATYLYAAAAPAVIGGAA
jgi:hypothetical protein